MALTFNAAINGDTLVGGGSWVNSDGLYLYYGVQEAALTGGGQFRNYLGDQAIDEYLIDLSALITTGPTALSLNPAGCEFPNNFIIDRAEVFVEVVAGSTGSGTLDVGLWDLTAGATISDTAIISAMTTAIMTAGATIDVILNPAGNTAWHIVRAMHLAGRCAGCAECERVCPMDIPLNLLNRKMAKELKELFDYEAGLEVNDKGPLTMFTDKDDQSFIK